MLNKEYFRGYGGSNLGLRCYTFTPTDDKEHLIVWEEHIRLHLFNPHVIKMMIKVLLASGFQKKLKKKMGSHPILLSLPNFISTKQRKKLLDYLFNVFEKKEDYWYQTPTIYSPSCVCIMDREELISYAFDKPD